MTGSNDNKPERHAEFGCRMVVEVFPRFMTFLYQHFDVKGLKDYWGDLAQTGLAQELKENCKGGGKGKGKATTTAKGGKKDFQKKCADCQKVIGNRVVI